MQLQALHLYTGHPVPLRSFYQEVLNCTVLDADDGFVIKTSTTDLYFHLAVGKPTYHFAFNIPWNQTAEALEWTALRVPLLDLGQGTHLANFKNWKAEAFYFFDPAGNIVEFIGREPIGSRKTESFSGSSLLSVSEIGIVTDDVQLTCRQLSELWEVPLFYRQPPTPNFAAAGDDEGLFIVVTEGRHWYPTHMPAAKAPLKAIFKSGSAVQRTLVLG